MKIETNKQPTEHPIIQAYLADGMLVLPTGDGDGMYYHEANDCWLITDWLPYDNTNAILFYKGDKITLEF